MTLNFGFSCLHLQRTRIISVYYIQIYIYIHIYIKVLKVQVLDFK